MFIDRIGNLIGGRSGAFHARRRRSRRSLVRCLPQVLGLEPRALLSTLVVTNDNDSGSGSLRNAINGAASGDVITFARSAYGTITLTSGPLLVNMINLTIQGPGASKVTVNGAGSFSDFELFSVLPPTDPPPPNFVPNSVSISGLTIANGNAFSNGGFGDGGGIVNFDALTLSNSVLENNTAPMAGFGGAIYSGCCDDASLNLVNDLFSGNSAGSASDTEGFSLGGAIFNASGVAVISSCTFVNNQALGFSAQGGAIQTSFGSTLTITGSTFQNNSAIGSQYGSGGAVYGDPAQVTINSSSFINNLAEGNSPFLDSSGGAIQTSALDWNNEFIQVTETISNSLFYGNQVIGAAGSGAPVQGGAITNFDGTLDVSGSTFINNQAQGGSTTTFFGAYATGGAIQAFACALELASDAFLGNEAVGGSSPLGVSFAIGGAVNTLEGNPQATNPNSTITDSVFSGNQAVAGAGAGASALTAGGAIAYVVSPVNISGSVFGGNQVIGSQGLAGAAGTEADGGAMWFASSPVTIQGGLIDGNTALGGSGGNAPGATGGSGGNGDGGGIADIGGSSVTITGTVISGNSASGGAGGSGSTNGTGGNGLGGGIECDGSSTLDMSGGAILANVAQGGAGGGNGFGGGVYTLGTTTFSDTLILSNLAAGGSDGGQGIGGGIYIAGGTTTLTNHTKVLGNLATTSNNNIYGP
jgi:hypothetical protein